jgi:RNA polymerase sigma-70 factor, ECF subfamily
MGQVMQQAIERRDSGIFPAYREDFQSVDECGLVAGVVANDPSAWREFQRRYDRLVLRCITKVTKGFSAVSLDDVREIYAQLYLYLCANGRAKVAAFDPERGCTLSSYVGMLATHCAYDWLRAVRREPQREALALAENLSSELPDPYEATEQNERAKLAARVLEGFSERDRVFAALYFGEGMDPDEIARSMKISVKTVYSKKHKIQCKLESIVASLKGADLAA